LAGSLGNFIKQLFDNFYFLANIVFHSHSTVNKG
jgi:hypothetical protein